MASVGSSIRAQQNCHADRSVSAVERLSEKSRRVGCGRGKDVDRAHLENARREERLCVSHFPPTLRRRFSKQQEEPPGKRADDVPLWLWRSTGSAVYEPGRHEPLSLLCRL